MDKELRFNKFDLICEDVESTLIFEKKNKGLLSYFSKRWDLEDELEILLPFITEKINSVFANLYDTGNPGELDLTAEPSIEPIDVGTDNPRI